MIYLFFFWTGLPALFGLIEGIVFLTKTDEAWAAKYDRPPGGQESKGLDGGSVAVLALGLLGIGVVGVALLGGPSGSTAGIGVPMPSGGGIASPSSVDAAEVARLEARVQANPSDADALMSLGDLYYEVGDWATARDWFVKVTEVEPTNVHGFLALGATAFNQDDLAGAETAWKQARAIDETNVEAHYYLGFLYLNQTPPDIAAVQREWRRVIELAPDSDIASIVRANLDSMSASPLPWDHERLATTRPVAHHAPAMNPNLRLTVEVAAFVGGRLWLRGRGR